MEDILSELSRPVWWISVVFSGIAINLIAAYIKPKLDKIFSSFSLRVREKIRRKSEDREKYIKDLEVDQYFLITELFSELRLRSQSIFGLSLGIFVIVSVGMFSMLEIFKIAFLAFAALSFFMSYISFEMASAKSELILSVVKRKKIQEIANTPL